MQLYLEKLVNQAEIVFWDFDGVIKDSVEVKSAAFEKLFSSYSQDLIVKIKEHHERNGGLSRFEKIPLYLSWSSEVVTDKKIQEYCSKFSLLVKQSVIDSPWAYGFLEFIERNYKVNKHILVTATPTKEIEEILKVLNIRHFFYRVYGAPDPKGGIIKKTLREMKISPKHAIMLGDSVSDFKAAKENNVLFFLRSTRLNHNLHSECKEYLFKDFANE